MTTIKIKGKGLMIFICLVLVMVGCVEISPPPTATSLIIASPTVASASTPSLFPLPTITLSLKTATVSVEQAYQNLISLLQNTNCTLPCLMGITPGVSTLHDVHNIMLPFARDGNLPMDSAGGISIEYPLGDFPITFNFYYFPSNVDQGMIDHIYLNTHVVNVTGPEDDPQLWESATYKALLQRYNLANVLSTFGQPPYVFVSGIPGGEPTASSFFDLRIAYPEKGLYLSYYSLLQRQGINDYRACPSASFISIWAEAPNVNVSPRTVLLKMNDWPSINTLNNFKPLEDATQMTLDKFYKTFSQPTNYCFVMPTKLWP